MQGAKRAPTKRQGRRGSKTCWSAWDEELSRQGRKRGSLRCSSPRKPGLQVPRLPRLRCWRGAIQQGSETDFEEGLSLARAVSLAGSAAALAIGADHSETERTVVQIGVWSATLHAVEDVEQLHPQLGVDVLSKIEVLGQAEIFIGVEGVAQLADDSCFIALREAGVRKSCS